MFFDRSKRVHATTTASKGDVSVPCVIIVEDDPDQLNMLMAIAELECKSFFQGDNYSESLCLVAAHSLSSLKTVLSMHKNVLQVILDCNIPDRKGMKAHDQFVQNNFRITGQHRAVDEILKLNSVPQITLVSAFNRFQKTVTQYYSAQHQLKIEFVRKSDAQRIQNALQRVLTKRFG